MKTAIVISWDGVPYGILIDLYIFQKYMGADIVWISPVDETNLNTKKNAFSKAYDKYLLQYDALVFIETELFGFLNKGQKRAGQKFYFMKNVDIDIFCDHNDYYENLHMIDVAIARTNITIKHYEELKSKYGYQYDIKYIKFTSLDYSRVYMERNYFTHKNPFQDNECVIIDRGDLVINEIPYQIYTPIEYSFLSFGRKNLHYITDFWNRHREHLPKLYIKSYADNEMHRSYELGNIEECRRNNKIEIIDRFIDEREKFELYNKCCFFINLSPAEGYGHNINEARSTGRVILVLNREPMNELVDNNCGILMDSLEEGISQALNLSSEEVNYKMMLTRQKYIMDTEFCINNLR